MSFDKQAQRQRAINLSQNLINMGHTAPVNPIPVKKVEQPKDMQGRVFIVGSKIVKPTKEGNTNALKICTVTHIAGMQVYCDHSRRSLGRPEKCLIL